MKDDLKKIVIENFESSSGNKLQNLKLSYQFFGKRLGTAPVILINHALTRNSIVSGNDGWLTEIVAGLCDENENVEDSIKREMVEEIGI